MYHRIINAETDPWRICVSPEHFKEHVQFLKNNFNVISSDEVFNQLRSGRITGNSICITFDDGYADNYTNAKPILEKYNCPATFFISTAFINQDEFFWWDELEFILLRYKKLPPELLLNIDGTIHAYTINEIELTEQQWLKHKQWKWYEEPPTKRCKVFLDLWEKLRPQSHAEIQKQMFAIKKWLGVNDNASADCLPMNEPQLLNLSKNNLFKIGLHTHTHADLYGKHKQLQLEEILRCKNVLNKKYGIESNCLAYPYGRFDNTTIEAVKELRLDACFTTEAIGININSDKLKLGRFQVCDWSLPDFKNQLIKWSEQLL